MLRYRRHRQGHADALARRHPDLDLHLRAHAHAVHAGALREAPNGARQPGVVLPQRLALQPVPVPARLPARALPAGPAAAPPDLVDGPGGPAGQPDAGHAGVQGGAGGARARLAAAPQGAVRRRLDAERPGGVRRGVSEVRRRLGARHLDPQGHRRRRHGRGGQERAPPLREGLRGRAPRRVARLRDGRRAGGRAGRSGGGEVEARRSFAVRSRDVVVLYQADAD